MSEHVEQSASADVVSSNVGVELLAGLSTYLTMSYVFLLNPVLLASAGIDISAAFFATIVSASLTTLLMGVWPRLPFAVAPAPSLTTFFVSYVVMTLGLTWQAALAAAILSGLLSVASAIPVRRRLIEAMPPALQTGVLFAIGGFLVANGLVQARLISYSGGFIDFTALTSAALLSPSLVVMGTGLCVTLLFRMKRLKFSGAPLLGIVAATAVAFMFDIRADSQAEFSMAMFSAVGQADFSFVLDPRFLSVMLIFFIIDFYGGVGKFVGLIRALGTDYQKANATKLRKALYVDGFGNVIGGVLGASSLAVFVSSAVGIAAGGRTGLTAVFTAGFILLSLVFIPLVGAIPVQATSGILIYVGFLLLPIGEKNDGTPKPRLVDVGISLAAAAIAFLTYGIDKAILVVFLAYSVLMLARGPKKSETIFYITAALLLIAVIAQINVG